MSQNLAYKKRNLSYKQNLPQSIDIQECQCSLPNYLREEIVGFEETRYSLGM